ncbi:MAG: hypothetical protein IKR48_12010 [Kiritimatiellae bacterium]|nr:hypothetical protein [Kiritimatiellia bacterium]
MMMTLDSLNRISTNGVLRRRNRYTGGGIIVKSCLFSLACTLLFVGFGRALTLGPGDTLDWDANTPASSETITATGGTIIFNSDTESDNNFELGGEVVVTVNNDSMVRFLKTFYQTDPSGRLVMPRTFRFGSRDANKFAFLPENSIAFAPGATDAQLRLAGYTSMLVLPDKWSNPVPYAFGTNVLVCFYGGNMITDAAYTMPSNCTIRMTSPTNFPETTVITVPATSTLQDRPAKFNPQTNAGSGVDNRGTTTERRNNIVLDGGTFEIATGSTHKYWGNFSGSGSILVSETVPENANGNAYKYFYGSVHGLDAQSTLTIKQIKIWDNNLNNGVRLNSDFAGTVKLDFDTSCSDIVSFGFNNPNTSGATNENWHVGAIQGGSIIGPRSGEGGARLQFSAMQHIYAGRLSGKFAIFATAVNNKLNTNDLFADTVADNTIIYVKNGIRLHFGTVGKGVKIRYMVSPVSSNVVEVGSGTIEEISFFGTAAEQTKPVYLHGNVGLVTGPGKVIASDGSRVGFVASNATVEVNSGALTLGDEELLGSKPALWVDASDLSTYAPLYKSSYHNNGTLHAPSTLLGADKPANVYTNDFPLIEKWYDKRPEQRLNFFWNNRWQDANTFYPQFYPFIITNALNGRAILSFGIHREAGDTGLSSEWSHIGSPGSSNSSENRRMHLMQSASEGHAVYVHSCVMVFGSERGGGRCILGGYNGYTSTHLGVNNTHNPPCGDHFFRTGSGYGVENGIFVAKIEGSGKNTKTNLYETWVNGTSVVCTNTPMSGSWDVISFHTDKADDGGRAFRNIGCPDDVNASGGQDYAEFIVYTNKLTSAERMSLEYYLACKWGLESKQLPVAGTVRVGANASVIGSQLNIAGAGSWTLRDYDEVTLDGQFTGTVSGPGKLKAIDAANVPTLSSAFTGELQFVKTSTPLTFTFANGTVTDAISTENGTVTIPDEVTITLACGSRPMSGRYPLVTAATLTAPSEMDVQLTGDAAVINGVKARLAVTATTLAVEIIPSGTVISIR